MATNRKAAYAGNLRCASPQAKLIIYSFSVPSMNTAL